MKSKYLKIGLLAIFVAVIISAFVFFDVREFLNVDALQKQIDEFGVWAPIIFIALYIIATVFFLPASPLSIVAGVLFGALFGTIYVVIGATIGAILAFLLARYLGQDFVEKFMKSWFKKIFAYNKGLEENGFQVVLFLRLVPLFPFNGLNFALGLTRVKFRDYALATAIGIIPGAFAFVYFGSSLASFDPWQIALAALLLFILIFAPTLYKKHKKKRGESVDDVITDDANNSK